MKFKYKNPLKRHKSRRHFVARIPFYCSHGNIAWGICCEMEAADENSDAKYTWCEEIMYLCAAADGYEFRRTNGGNGKGAVCWLNNGGYDLAVNFLTENF